MTEQQIDYVLAVAQERSFSKAAQKLYVTQPSLSQSIMAIEKKLGTGSFDLKLYQTEAPAKETLILAVAEGHPFNDGHSGSMLTASDIKNRSCRFITAESIKASELSELSFVVTDGGGDLPT